MVMSWWERVLLFGSLVVLFLCLSYEIIRWLPELWYALTLYRDAVYWALIAAAGVVAFTSEKE